MWFVVGLQGSFWVFFIAKAPFSSGCVPGAFYCNNNPEAFDITVMKT
jgi:hypothetical protein